MVRLGGLPGCRSEGLVQYCDVPEAATFDTQVAGFYEFNFAPRPTLSVDCESRLADSSSVGCSGWTVGNDYCCGLCLTDSARVRTVARGDCVYGIHELLADAFLAIDESIG